MKTMSQRLIAVLSAMTFTLSTAVSSSALVTCGEIYPSADDSQITGDVDDDGNVTANDALMILRASVGMDELPPEKITIADIDGDERITANDALEVLHMSVGANEDDESQKAKAAAAAAADAVRNKNFSDIVSYTAMSIPYHYTMDAFMRAADKTAYDDTLIGNYGKDEQQQLVFFTESAPVTFWNKYGSELTAIEFTDGEEISVDHGELIDEILDYQKNLPKYMIYFPPDPQDGVSVNLQEEDGDIKVDCGGSYAILRRTNVEGGVEFDEDEKPQLDVGSVYRFNVTENGKSTGKTVRVAFIDGKYRVLVPDLMSLL